MYHEKDRTPLGPARDGGGDAHTLRHTFASRLEDLNVNPFVVRDLMGHTTIRMTGHHTHSTAGALHRAVKQLETEKDCLKILTNEENRKTGS
jgi:integrase